MKFALLPKAKKLRKKINLTSIILLGFFAVIIAGTLLLKLPIASRNGQSVPFLTALFTATSAACVTGLVVVDTVLTWSLFGQAVILLLFQIGGLGFISITTVFFFIMSRKIQLSQRLLIVKSLSLNDRRGVIGLIRHVFIGTFIFEGIGAFVLWIRFIPDYGLLSGLGMGIFHSVSAFCNAGFDLMGNIKPFSSLNAYSGDKVIAITISMLVFFGGLGFFVWEDVWRTRCFKRLHLHSKMVLTISCGLVLLGWIVFYLTERTNPATIGRMDFFDAVVASLFQSIMPRSGGLSLVDQSSLTNVSKMVVMSFMLIGGSAGSTAGGIKNVTAGIVFLAAIRFVTGRKRVAVFGRNIPEPQVVNAFSILIMALTICFAGTITIVLIQPEFLVSDVLFEVVSAVATCGLSNGITPSLAPVSMVIIMLFMFLGRAGIMTVGMAVFLRRNKTEKTKYPDTWVMM